VAPPLMMGLTNKHERKTAEAAHTQQARAQIQVYAAQIKFTQQYIQGVRVDGIIFNASRPPHSRTHVRVRLRIAATTP
jgi:hypothetical protein